MTIDIRHHFVGCKHETGLQGQLRCRFDYLFEQCPFFEEIQLKYAPRNRYKVIVTCEYGLDNQSIETDEIALIEEKQDEEQNTETESSDKE